MIANQIEQQIITGELKPGDTIPSEAELMEKLGAGKYSVREALRVLETMGIIKVQHGSRKGPIVTSPTNDKVSDFLKRAIAVGEISGRHVTQFRVALEPSIAENLAATGLSPKMEKALEDNIASTKESYSRQQDITMNNSRFHLLLAKATGNPLFVVIIDTLLHAPVVTSLLPSDKDELSKSTIEHHGMILEAIRARDPERAREIMREHLFEIDRVWQRESVQESQSASLTQEV